MSNANGVGVIPGSDKKPLTAGFELETKIRVIIQEVLAATVRKLSLFGEKVERFEEYFITFKERFESGERERGHIQAQISKVSELQATIRRDINLKDVKDNEEREREGMIQRESREEVRELEKLVKSLLRQNESINSDLSKTKSKFLEYSNTITTLKEEVSWKITKYLEETADSHTQMKITSEQVKLQNFNMNLQIEKQKQKYDDIILKYEEDLVFRSDTQQNLHSLSAQADKNHAATSALNIKTDDLELALLSKIKNIDLRFEDKMQDLDKNSTKLTGAFRKIDNFNELLEGVKRDIEENAVTAANLVEQGLRRGKDYTDDQAGRTGREADKLDKKIDRKMQGCEQKMEKLEDFLLQKLDFLKMEIESDLSSKTTQMLEQNTRKEQNLSSSTLEDINARISKMQLETVKHVNRTETTLKEQLALLTTEVTRVTETQKAVQETIETISNGKVTVAPQASSGERVSSGEIVLMKDSVKEIRGRLESLEAGKEQLQKACAELRRSVEDKFTESEQKLNTKVQKVMFLVTKMRGDSIIRNQFSDKEIRQLKRGQGEMKGRIEHTWKLIPGMGECINMVMAIIFDAEFHHSKIIQDNLPLLAKDVEKFTTCCEGVIYEFREKRKPGLICYRHNEIKKTDLVKATFNAYIQLWEQLFEADLKNKPHLLPKGFYKKLVERNIKQKGSSERDGGQFNSLQQIKTSGNVSDLANRSESSEIMNSSFHIRKKRGTMQLKEREKEELIGDIQE